MNHRSVREKYVSWSDRRLKAGERRRVEEHLEGCDECRSYYEKMSMLFDRGGSELLPRLEPDPLLPTRIRTLAGGRMEAIRRRPALGWLRASVAAAVLVIAAAAGVLLGNGLWRGSAMAGSLDLAQAYYDAFSPADFSGTWEEMLGENNEGKTEGTAEGNAEGGASPDAQQ